MVPGCLKIGENSQHPAVVRALRLQAEPGEDAAHVGLDRSRSEGEPITDGAVGTPLGNQGEHFTFTIGQRVKGIRSMFARPDQQPHGIIIDIRLHHDVVAETNKQLRHRLEQNGRVIGRHDPKPDG